MVYTLKLIGGSPRLANKTRFLEYKFDTLNKARAKAWELLEEMKNPDYFLTVYNNGKEVGECIWEKEFFGTPYPFWLVSVKTPKKDVFGQPVYELQTYVLLPDGHRGRIVEDSRYGFVSDQRFKNGPLNQPDYLRKKNRKDTGQGPFGL